MKEIIFKNNLKLKLKNNKNIKNKIILKINFFNFQEEEEKEREEEEKEKKEEEEEEEKEEEGSIIIENGSNIIMKYLKEYKVNRIPWRIIINEKNEIEESLPIEIEEDNNNNNNNNNEDDPNVHLTNGIRFSNEGNYIEAVKSFEAVLKVNPEHKDALFNMASIFHMHGVPILSIQYVQKLLSLNPDDMVAQAFLWALAQSEDTKEQTIECYRFLSDLGSVMAQHKLAVLTGEGQSTFTVNPNYPKLIFDDMAPVFEKKLVETLGYNCPWKMLELINQLIQSSMISLSIDHKWRIVDIGCGSGLCGRLFSKSLTQYRNNNNNNNNHQQEHEQEQNESIILRSSDEFQQTLENNSGNSLLIGIDVSQQMVELSHQNGGYTHLFCDDLRNSLSLILKSIQQQQTLPINLIIAADTFLYVGLLGEIFSIVSQCLSSNGIFMFSTELLDNSPMRINRSLTLNSHENNNDPPNKSDLNNSFQVFEPEHYENGAEMLTSGRFAHSHEYILKLVEKYSFQITFIEDIIVRTESSIPLPGKIYILTK